MDTQFDVQSFVYEHPDKAQEFIGDWRAFVTKHPDASGIVTSEDFYQWANQNEDVDKSIWVGKILGDYVSSHHNSPPVRQTPQTEQSKAGDITKDVLALSLLSFHRNHPKIMEHDDTYQHIARKKRTDWLKANNTKEFYTQEGADFLYGSLDGKTTSVEDEVAKEFREKHPEKAQKYDENKTKIHKNLYNDQAFNLHSWRINHESQHRYAIAYKKDKTVKFADIKATVEKSRWGNFAQKHPEKASAYLKQIQEEHQALLKKDPKKAEALAKRFINFQRAITGEGTAVTDKEARIFPGSGTAVTEKADKEKDEEKQHIPDDIIKDAIGDARKPSEQPSQELPRQRQPETPRQRQPQTPRQRPPRGRVMDRANKLLNRFSRSPLSQNPASSSAARSAGRLASRAAANAARSAATAAGEGLVAIGWPVIAAVVIIIVILVIIIFFFGGEGDNEIAHDPTPSVYKPLDITKGVDKTEAKVGDTLEYTLRVAANSLAGDRVVITEKIPEGTTLVNASGGIIKNGNTVEWELTAIKNNKEGRVIPPRTGSPPAGFSKSVQTISITKEQIQEELTRKKSPYANHADKVFEYGQKHNVDPAFIMAIWWWENHYGKTGGYRNNPGSIVYVRDGYLGGQKKGVDNHGRSWGTWDTFEQGLEAIAILIKTEYYPRGQTDVWSIHSGIGNGQNAYHGRGDIGIGDIKTWEDYVGFYYHWVDTMNEISGNAGYNINQTIKLSVKVEKDNIWISNTGLGFAPGTGNTSTNQAVVKVGNPPEDQRPGTIVQVPVPPADERELNRQIMAHFRLSFSSDFKREHLMAAWEALWLAKQRAPKFFDLTQRAFPDAGILIITHNGTTMTDNRTGSIKVGPNTLKAGGSSLFKQILIHELGHIIHGVSGNPRDKSYDIGIRSAQSADKQTASEQNGKLTSYSSNEDESFAELVSYYVLDSIPEQPIDGPPFWTAINPLKTGKYPKHLEFIEQVLK